VNKFVKIVQNAAKTGAITKQQYKTLKGQILSGNEKGALNGFYRLLEKKVVLNGEGAQK
jgi:hypothetical protein